VVGTPTTSPEQLQTLSSLTDEAKFSIHLLRQSMKHTTDMPNRLLQNKKNTNKWKMTESPCNVPIENTYPWCRRLLVPLAVCRPEHLESLGSLMDKAKLT